MVLKPFSKSINVSKKIRDKDEIQRLKSIGKDMQIDNMGIIFRTKAFQIEEDILEKEYHSLINLYKKIEREKNFLPCPKLIYKEMELIHQILRDVYNEKKP